jgi:hypothetical protein
MASFWVDSQGGYVYMLGSPSGRFGGVKLARMPIEEFLNASGTTPFTYYMGNDTWSVPATSEAIIQAAPWLIPPKDPDWSLAKNYDNLPWSSQGPLITIAEFSVIYNPHLKKFLLITGRPCPASEGGGTWYYTADRITGPWSQDKLLMPNRTDGGHEWSYYGTYTTETFRYASMQTGRDAAGEVAGRYLFIFPNLMFNFYPWGISVNIVKPKTQQKTTVTFLTCVSDSSKLQGGAGADLHRVELEDEAVVESVQRGIRSRFYSQGRYSPTREQGTHHFHRLICEFIS